MSKQKREKFTASVTRLKPRPQKPFAQVEGELTQGQLEAIAGASGCPFELCGINHNETMMSAA